jgi:hypothetical protein
VFPILIWLSNERWSSIKEGEGYSLLNAVSCSKWVKSMSVGLCFISGNSQHTCISIELLTQKVGEFDFDSCRSSIPCSAGRSSPWHDVASGCGG